MKKLLIYLSFPSILLLGINLYNYFSVRRFDFDSKIEKMDLEVEIVELNKKFDASNIEQVFEENKRVAGYYFGQNDENKITVVDFFSKMYANEEFKTLCEDVNNEFVDLEFFKKELTYAFKTIKFFYNDFKIPTVYTIISGFGTDLFIDENIVIVSLEYFLADKTKWKSKTPQYIAETFIPQSIATKIILEIVGHLVRYDNEDKTLLNHMLRFGRVAYFTRVALPKVSEEIILEYTKKNFEYLTDIEKLIWNFLKENQYIYSDNYMTIRSYVGKSPFTQEISMECPGNIGGFIGYKIIKSLMNHNNFDVKELLENSNVQYFFNKSKYNPLQK
jgi:hypothetical protein